MPLTVFVLGVREASPLVAIVSLVVSLLILLQDRKSIACKPLWKLGLAAVVGIPVGVLLLQHAPEEVLRLVLGGFVIGFALFGLLRKNLERLRHRALVYMLGFLGGVLGGAFNIGGPPVIAFAAIQGWSPQVFRATLQGFFLISGAVVVAGHGVAGLWAENLPCLLLWCLPFSVLAVFIGRGINKRIPHDRFRTVVYIVLILLGVSLLV